ncbi:hypothetical protein TNCV_5079201 [Trichonephila clavipes]|nr:hypothetical protein TNCV_5079201 [Trichonephila clavipes]
MADLYSNFRTLMDVKGNPSQGAARNSGEKPRNTLNFGQVTRTTAKHSPLSKLPHHAKARILSFNRFNVPHSLFTQHEVCNNSLTKYVITFDIFIRKTKLSSSKLNSNPDSRSINEYQVCSGTKTLGVSLQTNHLIGTSAHAPLRPMVTYTEIGTIGLDAVVVVVSNPLGAGKPTRSPFDLSA